MGVSSTTNRVVYAGDGVTTTFAFAYYFFAKADLVVYKYDTLLGGTTLLILNTGYTITGTANAQGLYPNGGNVVMGAAPLSTDILVIFRAPSEVQNYALLQNGNISSVALVQQMDYLTLLIQRLQDQVSRATMIPDGMGATFSNQLPETMALPASEGATLVVNATGNGFDLGPSSSGTAAAVAACAASEAAAASSATAAATSASGASTSASNASTSATAAASSATAAAASATAAAASATSAAAAVASVGIAVTGTKASPSSIIAGSGIAFTGSILFNKWFIKGVGGVIVSANPQIVAGNVLGQELDLYGTSDTDTLELQDSNGLDLNGTWIGGANSKLSLEWDGSLWSEKTRR